MKKEEMKKMLVFGTGKFADMVSYVLEKKLGYSIQAYTVHEEYLHEAKNYSCSEFAQNEAICSLTYKGKPLTAFEDIQKDYPPKEYAAAVCMIGKQMFDQREEIFQKLREMGYEMPNIIDPTASIDTQQIGEGNIILANTAIESHCRIGDGNIFWQNVVLSYHNQVGDFNNLAPSVSLSDYSRIGNHCFVGNNVCIKSKAELSDYVYAAPGSYISKSVASHKVIIPYRSYELTGKTGFDFL